MASPSAAPSTPPSAPSSAPPSAAPSALGSLCTCDEDDCPMKQASRLDAGFRDFPLRPGARDDLLLRDVLPEHTARIVEQYFEAHESKSDALRTCETLLGDVCLGEIQKAQAKVCTAVVALGWERARTECGVKDISLSLLQLGMYFEPFLHLAVDLMNAVKESEVVTDADAIRALRSTELSEEAQKVFIDREFNAVSVDHQTKMRDLCACLWSRLMWDDCAYLWSRLMWDDCDAKEPARDAGPTKKSASGGAGEAKA